MDSAAYICSLQRRMLAFPLTPVPNVTTLHRACGLRKKPVHPQVLQTRVSCPTLHYTMGTYASAITPQVTKLFLKVTASPLAPTADPTRSTV